MIFVSVLFLIYLFGNEINAVNVYSRVTTMMMMILCFVVFVDDNYDGSYYSWEY